MYYLLFNDKLNPFVSAQVSNADQKDQNYMVILIEGFKLSWPCDISRVNPTKLTRHPIVKNEPRT